MAVSEPTMVCPGCGRRGRWRPEFAGKRIKCPCGSVMTAPVDPPPAVVPIRPTRTGNNAAPSKAITPPPKAIAPTAQKSAAPTRAAPKGASAAAPPTPPVRQEPAHPPIDEDLADDMGLSVPAHMSALAAFQRMVSEPPEEDLPPELDLSNDPEFADPPALSGGADASGPPEIPSDVEDPSSEHSTPAARPDAPTGSGSLSKGSGSSGGLYDIIEEDLFRKPNRPAAQSTGSGAGAGSASGSGAGAGRAGASRANGGAPVPGAFPRPRSAPSDASDDRTKRLLMIGGPIVLVVVIAAVIGIKTLSGGGHGDTVRQMGDDARVEAMIRDENGMEIHEWMKENPSRIVMGMTPGQAVSYADKWQKMGAKRVMAFGATMSTTLAIELPDASAQRKELFAWQKQWYEETQDKPDTDEGQKWLLVRMRP